MQPRPHARADGLLRDGLEERELRKAMRVPKAQLQERVEERAGSCQITRYATKAARRGITPYATVRSPEPSRSHHVATRNAPETAR